METEDDDKKFGDTGSWERSGDILEDQLKMYTESYLYDCTFNVGDDDNREIFKCHKLILARASSVFEKMLFGDFQESAKGKDDPILLKNVNPEAFDLVMRFIYGNVQEFESVRLACEVYKFAHEWQMDSLMSASRENFKDVEPEDVLLVYELFKFLNDDIDLEDYQKMILENTSEVFSSPNWPLASASTVEEIFKSPRLQIKSEMELFEALVNWGAQNTESDSASEIRSMIDPALKQIRFRTMDSGEFSELCASTDVLCEGEKLQILMSISLNDANYMPPEFSVSKDYRDLDGHFSMNFKAMLCASDTQVNNETPETILKISVEGDGLLYLSSICLSCLCAENEGLEADLLCSLKSPCCDNNLAVAKFKGVIDANNTGKIDFCHPVLLQKGVWYTISVSYFNKDPLVTKIVEYRNSHKTWIWKHVETKMHIFKNIESHTDICNIEFFKR